jgi:hypothetical protein
MAKKTTRRSAKKSAAKGAQKREQRQQSQDFSKLPVGSPVEHPDAVHLQNVENLQTDFQSVITDMLNNRDEPSALFPGVIERLEQIRATVLRLVQGAHTAHMEAADQPPQPIISHSSPTSGGLVAGVSRPSARAARGAQARGADTKANNPPQTPPQEPPAQTPPAKQEPGARL